MTRAKPLRGVPSDVDSLVPPLLVPAMGDEKLEPLSSSAPKRDSGVALERMGKEMIPRSLNCCLVANFKSAHSLSDTYLEDISPVRLIVVLIEHLGFENISPLSLIYPAAIWSVRVKNVKEDTYKGSVPA